MAVAIAAAGADVHAARVTTIDGVARDRFDLSDRTCHKLDATLQEAIRAGLLCGVTGLRVGRRSGPARPGNGTLKGHDDRRALPAQR
jgi:hypothetical protein